MKASLPYNFNVYEKKNKLYVVVDYKDVNGKRKKKWIPTGLTAGTKEKEVKIVAEKLAANFYKEITSNAALTPNALNANTNLADSDISANNNRSGKEIDFLVFMDKWLEYKKPQVAKATYNTYRTFVKSAKRYFEDKKFTVQSVTPMDVQDFYSSLIKSGLKVVTLKGRHLYLHNIFEYAIKLDLILFNPSSRVDLPRAETREAVFYSKEELDDLFKAFANDSIELVVHIAAYYGLRRSEVIGLKWDSIDFVQKTLTIRRKVVYLENDDGKRELFCEETLKTSASRRTLPLIPHIEDMLLKKKEQQEHFKKLLGSAYNMKYDGFVCTNEYGNLINPDYVTMHFKAVVDTNGLRHLRFHDLRHTCASLLVANKIPLKAVQDWLGHANFQTTANIYSHLDYSSRIQSAETIAKLLSGQPDDEATKKKKRGRKNKSSSDTATSDGAAADVGFLP